MEPAQAESLIKEFGAIPRPGYVRPTFLEISGYPHYENVCSNLLAFFLDPQGPHALGSLCLDALLQTLGQSAAQSNVTVDREVQTNAGNKLDLLVESDTHVIGIENKIFHAPSNPFDDYASFLEDRSRDTGKHCLKVLLSLLPSAEPGCGFACVSHARLVQNIRSGLGSCVQQADSHYLTFLIDFMTTMENLARGPQMNTAWLQFMLQREGEVQTLLGEIKAFRAEMRNKVTQLGGLMVIPQPPNVRQWFYRETDYLFDTLVHDIKVSEDLPVAIDTVISVRGWEIQIFVRSGGNMETLRAVLKSLAIEFSEREGRLIYTTRFPYSEPPQNIQPHLQVLVEKIAGFTQAASANASS